MVAPRKTKKIFCTVVRVSVADDTSMTNNRFSTRPSDLLPWADPYIARLVTKLQDEVRDERKHFSTNNRIAATLQAEIEPAGPQTETDWDWQDETRRIFHDKI